MNLEEKTSEVASVISESMKKGGKLLICGNGGSFAEAQHFAAGVAVSKLGTATVSSLEVIEALSKDASLTDGYII